MRFTHPTPRVERIALWFGPVLVFSLLLFLFGITSGGSDSTANAQVLGASGTATVTTTVTSTPTETDFASATPTPSSTATDTFTETPTATFTSTDAFTETSTSTATGTLTVTPTPSMSCCERNIKLKDRDEIKIQSSRGVGGGTTTVTIRVPLNMQWRCVQRPDQDCAAYYKVVLRQSFWERLDKGDWVIVNAADILSETIIPDPPLVSACDGQRHTGQWGFTYKAVLNTTQKLRNKHLEMRLRFPRGLPDKGTRYDAVIDYRQGNNQTTIVVTPLQD